MICRERKSHALVVYLKQYISLTASAKQEEVADARIITKEE